MEVDDLIAELCLSAPSESVKNCLRIYDYFKTTAKIESDMYQNCTKAILVETANLLKIRNAALKNKEPLTHLIVCRIQNLLPDNCGICKERYSVKLLDTPLLECAICGQELAEHELNRTWRRLPRPHSLILLSRITPVASR